MTDLTAPLPGATRTEVGGVVIDEVPAGAGRLKRVTYPPGWRWSVDMRASTSNELCQHGHVGFLVQGHMIAEYADGCRVDQVAPTRRRDRARARRLERRRRARRPAAVRLRTRDRGAVGSRWTPPARPVGRAGYRTWVSLQYGAVARRSCCRRFRAPRVRVRVDPARHARCDRRDRGTAWRNVCRSRSSPTSSSATRAFPSPCSASGSTWPSRRSPPATTRSPAASSSSGRPCSTCTAPSSGRGSSGRSVASGTRRRSPYLLVEGANVFAGPCNPNGIRGALLAVADLGVALIRSLDVTDTSLWLHRLALREQRRRRAVDDTANRLPDPGVAALAGIAGISRTTAQALIDAFGSVEGIVAAGPKRWLEVDGIGEVRANAIAAALLGLRTTGNCPARERDPVAIASTPYRACSDNPHSDRNLRLPLARLPRRARGAAAGARALPPRVPGLEPVPGLGAARGRGRRASACAARGTRAPRHAPRVRRRRRGVAPVLPERALHRHGPHPPAPRPRRARAARGRRRSSAPSR